MSTSNLAERSRSDNPVTLAIKSGKAGSTPFPILDGFLDDLPDYLGLEDLRGLLSRRQLTRLRRAAFLVGLDGRPCWPREYVVDLLKGGTR